MQGEDHVKTEAESRLRRLRAGTPKIANNHQKLKEAAKPLAWPSEGAWPRPHLDFGLQPPE